MSVNRQNKLGGHSIQTRSVIEKSVSKLEICFLKFFIFSVTADNQHQNWAKNALVMVLGKVLNVAGLVYGWK